MANSDQTWSFTTTPLDSCRFARCVLVAGQPRVRFVIRPLKYSPLALSWILHSLNSSQSLAPLPTFQAFLAQEGKCYGLIMVVHCLKPFAQVAFRPQGPASRPNSTQ